MENKTTCMSCVYYDSFGDPVDGEATRGGNGCGHCRFSPPSIDQNGYGVWPEVCHWDWCSKCQVEVGALPS